jgi:hypothetical protein
MVGRGKVALGRIMVTESARSFNSLGRATGYLGEVESRL